MTSEVTGSSPVESAIPQRLVDKIAKIIFPYFAGGSESWSYPYFEKYKDAEHEGDCALAKHKGPVTCSRCCIEESRQIATIMIKAAGTRLEYGADDDIVRAKEDDVADARATLAWGEK